jgi:hypothetical protein
MNLRETWRSGLSLLLAISIVLWSATLFADHMGGSAQRCHVRKAESSQHQCRAEETAEPAGQSQLDSSTCCPMHEGVAAQHCESANQCCLWDGEAPSTAALVLTTGHFPSKQIQHASAAHTVPQPSQVLLRGGPEAAHPYAKPIQEKKTDLRI